MGNNMGNKLNKANVTKDQKNTMLQVYFNHLLCRNEINTRMSTPTQMFDDAL